MTAFAKRLPPPDLPIVLCDGFWVEVIHWGKASGLPHNGGYLRATDAHGGKTKIIEVYAPGRDAGLESDVQDVFIRSLQALPRGLAVENEKGERFFVDVRMGTARRLEQGGNP